MAQGSPKSAYMLSLEALEAVETLYREVPRDILKPVNEKIRKAFSAFADELIVAYHRGASDEKTIHNTGGECSRPS